MNNNEQQIIDYSNQYSAYICMKHFLEENNFDYGFWPQTKESILAGFIAFKESHPDRYQELFSILREVVLLSLTPEHLAHFNKSDKSAEDSEEDNK